MTGGVRKTRQQRRTMKQQRRARVAVSLIDPHSRSQNRPRRLLRHLRLVCFVSCFPSCSVVRSSLLSIDRRGERSEDCSERGVGGRGSSRSLRDRGNLSNTQTTERGTRKRLSSNSNDAASTLRELCCGRRARRPSAAGRPRSQEPPSAAQSDEQTSMQYRCDSF